MSELIHEAIDLFLREVAPEPHEDAAQEGQGAEEPGPGSEPGRPAT
jgi:hypothetical protein